MAGTPTQVAHPYKAILRTFVASGVAVALAWLANLGLDLTAFSEELTSSLTAAAWAVVLGLVQALLSWEKAQPFLEWVRLDTGVKKEDEIADQGKEQNL